MCASVAAAFSETIHATGIDNSEGATDIEMKPLALEDEAAAEDVTIQREEDGSLLVVISSSLSPLSLSV